MTQPPHDPRSAPQHQQHWQGYHGAPQGLPVWQPQPWAGQQPSNYGPSDPLAGFAPPPRRSGIKPWMWIVGVVVVLAVVGAVTNVIRKGHHHAADYIAELKTGQCVTTSDFKQFHFTSTSCEAPDAVYELAGETAMGLCPDGKEPQDGPYFYATPNQADPKAEGLCFALSLRQGDCYALDTTAKSVTRIDCAQGPTIGNSHTAVFKVAQRLDGMVEETACTGGAKAMVFISPQRVYCLTKLVA